MTARRCGALIVIALINSVPFGAAQAQSPTAGDLLAACKAFVDSTLEESNAFDETFRPRASSSSGWSGRARTCTSLSLSSP